MKCPSVVELPRPPTDRRGWPWTEGYDSSLWLARRSNWPRVSIVIPSFNQGEFIEEALRSVLLQGYPDLECIVFDAASIDDSVNVIVRYSPWLAFWASEKDWGQSHAINKGLQHCTGVFFNWHNSDDVLAPGSLFHTVSALLEHPEASYVHGYRLAIDPTGRILSSSVSSYGPQTRFAPTLEDSITNLKTGMQPGCLMRKQFVDNQGGLDESLHFVMEADLLLKLSLLGLPLYVHALVVHYRCHSRTKSLSMWPVGRGHERLRVVRNLFRMKGSDKYCHLRRKAKASGHRYAWQCAGMNNQGILFLYHFVMDVLYSPFGAWDKRWAVLQGLRHGR